MSFDLTGICCLISITGACLSQFSIWPKSEIEIAISQWARFAVACLQMPLLLSKYCRESEKRVKERRECLLARTISNVFTLPAKKQKKNSKELFKFFCFSSLGLLFFLLFSLHTSSPCPGDVRRRRLPSSCRCPLVSLSVLCAISIRIQVPADLKVNWPSRVLYLLLPLHAFSSSSTPPPAWYASATQSNASQKQKQNLRRI